MTIACLLLCCTILLILIPRTRRSTNNWIVALKSVQPGCAVFILLNILCGVLLVKYACRLYPLNLRHIFPAAILIMLGVIIWLARFFRKHYRAENKFSILPFILLFFFFAAAVPVAEVAYDVAKYALLYKNGNYKGDWKSIAIPPENGTELIFDYRSIHPMLAEYDYRLCMKKNGTKKYIRLQTNCGGRTAFNIYRLRDGRLLFRDKDADYIADADKQEVWYLFRQGGCDYAGFYSDCGEDNFNGVSWSSGGEAGRVFFSRSGDAKNRTEAVRLTDELDGKVFYGTIDYCFLPAAKRPEFELKTYNSLARHFISDRDK